MVAQIRKAGTQIRKQELMRQKMNAEANIDYAIFLQKRINDDVEIVSEPIQKTVEIASKRFQNGATLDDIIDSGLVELISRGIPAITKRQPRLITRDIKDVNAFVEDVINNIIKDLSKEGIYMPRLNQVDTDVLLPFALSEAKDLINKSVDILRSVIDASK